MRDIIIHDEKCEAYFQGEKTIIGRMCGCVQRERSFMQDKIEMLEAEAGYHEAKDVIEQLNIMNKVLVGVIVKIIKALKEIQLQGKVCETFEICKHEACQSSYSSWVIADTIIHELDGNI